MRPMQKKIIKALGVKPKIDPKYEATHRINFIKNYMKATGIHVLVLGISGGVDSSLTGKLCELAVTQLREETGDNSYKFIAVRLPYDVQADESDAMKAIKWIKPDKTMRVNIGPATDAIVKSTETKENGIKISDFNKGNAKARMRMIAQYLIAGQTNGLVVGTDHAAEAIVAFYTKFGDGACDIVPIECLDKKQVREVIAYLGAPSRLVHKVPTADLESKHPDQADNVELGASYKDVDDFLEGKDINPKVASMLEHKFVISAHKRHMPVSPVDTWMEKLNKFYKATK